MRHRFALILAASIAGLFQPAAVAAQSRDLEVRVRLESSDGTRLSGALVALLDSAQRVVVEGVSDGNGSRLFRAPPGSYVIRVRRIGFLPFVSPGVLLPRTNDIVLRVESARVALRTVTVTSRSKCGAIDRNEREFSVLWDEIAKALRTSQLSARDLAGVAEAFVYRTQLAKTGAVVSSDTTFHPVSGGKPFGMVDPGVLAAQGYVRGDARAGWTYYGPDEAVLLSDHFAETHCFRIVRDRKRSGEVGIDFKPVSGRPVADIAGVLWVDEGTAELRELVFRFVNAGVLDRFSPGGSTQFRRVPSGAWIVDSWMIRGPVLTGTDRTFGVLAAIGSVVDGGGMRMREPLAR